METTTPQGPLDLQPALVDLEEIARGAALPALRHKFRLRLDQELFIIANATPTGAELLALACKSVPEWCLFQHLKGGAEEYVEPTDTVDLVGRGVERFETRRPISLCIEGQEFPWCRATITREQIAELGGWDVSLGVIEVDQHNNERTLAPSEVIEIKPGMGFGKKHRWKRG